MTEIIYACTPDRYSQLATSIASLLKSNSQFDKVTVYLEGSEKWDFQDNRVQIQETKRIYKHYFYGNKRYLCQSNSDRVVFIDTDTLILKPINYIWENTTEDFLGRIAACTKYGPPAGKWRQDIWDKTCSDFGSKKIGMYNAGVLIFQNSSHKKLDSDWDTGIKKYLSKEYALPYPAQIMPEQFSLSLAIGKQNLSIKDLTAKEHCYAWMGELDSVKDPIIVHTRNERFEEFARKLGYRD